MADVNARANLDVSVSGESEIDKLNKKLRQKRKPITVDVTEKIKTVRQKSSTRSTQQAAAAMARAQRFQARQQAAAARAATAANRANATAALTSAANSIRAAARALYRASVTLRTGIQGSQAGQNRVGATNLALQRQIAALTRAVQAANRQNLARPAPVPRGGGAAAAAAANMTGAARARRFRRRTSDMMRGNTEQLEDPIEIAFSVIRIATRATAKLADVLAAGVGRVFTPAIAAMQRIGPRFNRFGMALRRFGGSVRVTANAVGATVGALAAATAVLGITTVYLGATAGIKAIKDMLSGINDIAKQATDVAQNARLYGTTVQGQNKTENFLRGLPGIADKQGSTSKFLKEFQDKIRRAVDDKDEFDKTFGAKDGDISPKKLFGFDHKEFKKLNQLGQTGVLPFFTIMEQKLRDIQKEGNPAKLATAFDTIGKISEELAAALSNALNRKPGELIRRAVEEGSNRGPVDSSLATRFQQDYQFAKNAVEDLLTSISERLFKPLGDKLISFQKILQGSAGKAFEDAAVDKIKLVADSIEKFLVGLSAETVGNAVRSMGDLVNALVRFGEKTVEVAGQLNNFFRGLENSKILRAAGFDFRSDNTKRDDTLDKIQTDLVAKLKQRSSLESEGTSFGARNRKERLSALNNQIADLEKLLREGRPEQGPPAPSPGFLTGSDKVGEDAGQALIDRLKSAGDAVGSLFGTHTVESIKTGATSAGQSIGDAATSAMQASATAIGGAIGAAIAAAIRGAIPSMPGTGAGGLNKGSDGPLKG